MPTIDDAKRAPPGYFWPLGSSQAREQRERELARYEEAVRADERKRLAATPASAEPEPAETPAAPNENNGAA